MKEFPMHSVLSRFGFIISLFKSLNPESMLQRRSEEGQASVEYALVLLAAAVIATVLISWATNTNVLDSLFDYVVNTIRGKVN
jgi:Flp pilus assembly pilin Flp